MRLLILFGAAVMAAAPPAHGETLPGPYRAEVLRVLDGDTVEARIRIWLGQDVTTRIRLRDVDAPEMTGPCAQAAVAARDALASALTDGPITLTQIGADKYGARVLAHLWVRGEEVGEKLRRSGVVGRWGERRC